MQMTIQVADCGPGKLQEVPVKQCRLGMPPLFGSDVRHGSKYCSPVPVGLASSLAQRWRST
jgi:hypothetical protein